MKHFLVLFLIIFVLSACSNADRILLITDRTSVNRTHSIFIKSFGDRGHDVVVKTAEDSSLKILEYGEPLYDHLVLFAPSSNGFGGSASVAELVKFIDIGGNILIAADKGYGNAMRKLATEVGFELDSVKNQVIDKKNYDQVLDNGQHTTIVTTPSTLIDSSLIIGEKSSSKLYLFNGISLKENGHNPLRMTVLTGTSTAYSFNPSADIKEHPTSSNKPPILIGAIQARNNARVLISGSLDFFSDKFFNAVPRTPGTTTKEGQRSGNADLAISLTKWVFKETGVLRIKNVTHKIVGHKIPPSEYTIMDDIEYAIEIEELSNGKWVPFKASDVQLEFVRIDPFVRTTLKNKNGKFSTTFKIPDVYGVYKFLVDYHRIGYTHLADVKQVSVRPLKHTQYERFSRCAYPYYISVFSMIIGVFLFSIVFLYHKDPSTSASKNIPSKTATK